RPQRSPRPRARAGDRGVAEEAGAAPAGRRRVAPRELGPDGLRRRRGARLPGRGAAALRHRGTVAGRATAPRPGADGRGLTPYPLTLRPTSLPAWTAA